MLCFPIRSSVFRASFQSISFNKAISCNSIFTRISLLEPFAFKLSKFEMKKGVKQTSIAQFFGGAICTEKNITSQPSISNFFGNDAKQNGSKGKETQATPNESSIEKTVSINPNELLAASDGLKPSIEISPKSQNPLEKHSMTEKKRAKSVSDDDDSESKSEKIAKKKNSPVSKPATEMSENLGIKTTDPTKKKRRLKKVSENSDSENNQEIKVKDIEKSENERQLLESRKTIPTVSKTETSLNVYSDDSNKSTVSTFFKKRRQIKTEVKEQNVEKSIENDSLSQDVLNSEDSKSKTRARGKAKVKEGKKTSISNTKEKLVDMKEDEIALDKEKVNSVFGIDSDSSSSSSDHSQSLEEEEENDNKMNIDSRSKATPKRKPNGKRKTTAINKDKEKEKENDNSSVDKIVEEDECTDKKGQVLIMNLKEVQIDESESANWQPGEPVPFLFLAEAFERISKESGRIASTEIMRNVFLKVMEKTPDDLLCILYLAGNRIAPPHEGIELGIGDSTIIKALAEATGKKDAQITKEYKTIGDLGSVARLCRNNQPCLYNPLPLTCKKVFQSLQFIAKASGTQSNDKKRAQIKHLIVSAKDIETVYIIRLLQSKMRIGLAEQSLLVSLAHASVFYENKKLNSSSSSSSLSSSLSSKSIQSHLEQAVNAIKTAYCVLPVYDTIVNVILTHGWSKLTDFCELTPGIPISPMLAKPTKGISEILDKFNNIVFTCEYKYDGERAQIHYLENGEVEIYSRNAERNTGKFPDLINTIKKYKKENVTSIVIDSEVVAYDREKDRILPFQILSTRARKGVILSDIKIQICIFAFDCLFINGESLLQEQLIKRREHLSNAFNTERGFFEFATSVVTKDVDEMQTFLNDSVNHGCEGCMVKTLIEESTYEPSKRSNNWLKLKKDYMDNLGDSLDLVPIGGYYGKGKRTGFYGAFLLACYDANADEYQSICKIGTGFSDSMLEERSSKLKNSVIEKPLAYYRFGEGLGVDVWFQPVEVWEIKAADLSISPVHRAANGIVDESKGIALRFPRFLRVRDDKTPENATTAEQVSELYRAQKFHHNGD